MARRFQRKRWRRPQRLTLEGPPPARRKDVTAPVIMVLEPWVLWQYNRRRMAVLLFGFIVASALEGLLIGLFTGSTWLFAPFAGLALLYIVLGARLGDAWMRTILRATPARNPSAENLLDGLARESGIPTPELLMCPGEAPNAIALGLRRRWLVITEGAARLGRLEQEALLAHELVHISCGDAALASALVLIGGAPELAMKGLRAKGAILAWISFPLWPMCMLLRVLEALLIPADREQRADVSGALLTRYPPGMRKMLESAGVEQSDSRLRATDPFWIAARLPAGVPDAAQRAEAVSEM